MHGKCVFLNNGLKLWDKSRLGMSICLAIGLVCGHLDCVTSNGAQVIRNNALLFFFICDGKFYTQELNLHIKRKTYTTNFSSVFCNRMLIVNVHLSLSLIIFMYYYKSLVG